MSTATARARRPLPALKVPVEFRAVVLCFPKWRIVDSINYANKSDEIAAHVNARAKRLGDRKCKAISVPIELAIPSLS